MGRSMGRGILQRMDGVFGQIGGDIAWKVYVGETEELAVKVAMTDGSVFNPPAQVGGAASGAWANGVNWRAYPRVRGTAMCLKIANGELLPWEMEGVESQIIDAGERRL